MAQTYNEGRHAAEFILSEATGTRSRGSGTIASGAGTVAPGTVLGQITGTGKYVPRDVSAVDGSEVAAAVNIYAAEATSADADVALILRDAEINGNILTYVIDADEAVEKASAAAELAAAGIIVR